MPSDKSGSEDEGGRRRKKMTRGRRATGQEKKITRRQTVGTAGQINNVGEIKGG